MIHKYPKPALRRYVKSGAKILFVAELLAFAASYAVWYKLNTQRDFRLYMHNHYSTVLDAYYNVGEFFDSGNNCRTLDKSIWLQEGKIHK